jgi:hypothetical protein
MSTMQQTRNLGPFRNGLQTSRSTHKAENGCFQRVMLYNMHTQNAKTIYHGSCQEIWKAAVLID